MGAVIKRHFPASGGRTIMIPVCEIPAMNVVHETVAITINPVSGNFPRIGPDVRFNVPVCEPERIIDNGDKQGFRTS